MNHELPVTERARNARMSLRQQSDAAVARIYAQIPERVDALVTRSLTPEAAS